ncbi:hypothetical protein [Halobacillus campisalis]|uniref:DUF58 domain-containing protein n=1 Tax=Halobacillus campisalis TaxID=435909 RepID=A0ABW2K359_9BACI|nr:hypothetical protein [Halobacillus campisalis]
MIAEMYKRREKLAYIYLTIILLVFGGYITWNIPANRSEWLETLFFLGPVLLIIFIAVSSRNHYNKVKDLSIPHSKKPIIDLDHIVLKQDSSAITRLLAFENSGELIGKYQPAQLPKWLFPIAVFKSSLLTLFPFKTSFVSSDGNTLFTFERKGFKKSSITVYDQKDEVLGVYQQEEFKGLFHIKGELKDENDQSILPVKVSGTSGDFTLKDHANRRWAYFYNGRFPHEYTKIFRDTDNDIVEISNAITLKEKKLLLALIGYLFLERSNRK